MSEISAEEKRGAYRSWFERLLETIDDAIVGTDADFRVTVWNAGAERLYGYTAAEVMGRPSREVATFDGDQSRRRVEESLLESERARAELTAYRKDGTRVEVELVVAAVRDDRGEVAAYIGVHRDMTEQRAAQRRIETILENITDAFCALDRDFSISYLNERAVQIFGELLGESSTRENFLGRSVWDVFPDALGTPAEENYRRSLNEREPIAFEYAYPPTGSWFEIHTYPSEDGITVYFRPIDERKRAEAEREARERQQAVVAALGVRALAEGDPQVVMDEAVAAVARTLDIEIAGVAEILPDHDAFLLRAGIGCEEGSVGHGTGPAGPGSLVGYTTMLARPVVSDDLATDDRFAISPLIADLRPVSAIAVPIPGRDEPFGVLGAFARQQRSFSSDDINFVQAVANVLSVAFESARTEARLRDVREAERRRIARDLHDEALQGLTYAIAAATESPDEIIDVLKRVGRQLRGAIYDLRLEEDENRPLAERLESLVEVQAEMAGDVRVTLDVGRELPAVHGHRGTEVVRIVGEAVTNARRHSGATEIHVDAYGADDLLRVEVSDDGHGFDAADGRSPARSTGLRGIRERADLLRADLHVEAAPTRGTVVRLELALTEAPEDAQVRILLVEDHAAVREAIAAMLEREPDFTVVGQAGSLADARAMLEGVDVAVVDLGLPDGFGADLIPELRKKNPRAEALVLSGSVDRTNTARAVESGAAGTIDKVAELGDVVDAVRRLRAGETLLPLNEMVELLRHERHRREQERADRQAIEELTRREREVLQALADGLDSQAIAERLHITLRTERNHVANILAKLGVHSRLQALVFALRYGAVEIH